MSGRKKKQPVVTVEEPEEPTFEDPAVSSASGDDDDDDDDDSGAADDMRKMVETLSAELSKVKIALSKERRLEASRENNSSTVSSPTTELSPSRSSYTLSNTT